MSFLAFCIVYHDILWILCSGTPWAATRESTDGDARDWFVVDRRSAARHTMGQCAKCGETNHVTARCRHRDKVQCRVCGKRGHKEKHHTSERDCY